MLLRFGDEEVEVPGHVYVLREGRPLYPVNVEVAYFLHVQREQGRKLDRITELLEAIVSEQSHLDADVAQILSDVDTIGSEIKAEIDAAKAANPGVDLSGLDAAIAKLDGLAAAQAPVAPAPPVVPTGTADAGATPPTDAGAAPTPPVDAGGAPTT